jgi:hypothetical protein
MKNYPKDILLGISLRSVSLDLVLNPALNLVQDRFRIVSGSHPKGKTR